MRRISPAATTPSPTTPERSRLMARVRRSGTAPEVALRTALRGAGLPYRMDGGGGLPGTPDITFRRSRVALFVDGCFWHGCPQHATTPKTNTSFWTAKILRNRERDKQVNRSLKKLGWQVLRLWEHQVRRDVDGLVVRIGRLLKGAKEPPSPPRGVRLKQPSPTRGSLR